MSAKATRNILSPLIEGIKRNQITIINAAVTVILIGIVITVLLSRATSLQRKTAEESAINLAGITASEVQASYLSYLNIVRVTSQVIKNYKNVEIDQRRTFINNIMYEIIDANTTVLNVYSLWKPNELDDMDAIYANTSGNDETGQFMSGYTRELGAIQSRAFPEYKYTLDYGYHAVEGSVGEPFPLIGPYGGSWIIDVHVPILDFDGIVVGIIGVTINLEMLQNLVEAKRPFGVGRTMICTGRGTLVAHSLRQLRGVSFMAAGIDVDQMEPLLATAIRTSVFFDIQSSMINVLPTVCRYGDTLMVSHPLRTIDPSTAAYQAVESGFPRWAVVTAVPESTILAPINALIRFSILFIIGAAIIMVIVVLATSRSLAQRAYVLQRNLERASAMQDSLRYGLFLMDNRFVMQGAYSRALERILSVSDLNGKNFLDLMSSSIKSQEKEGLADYFDMIFKSSFDKEMLDSINPILEFEYINPEKSERKNLRTSFTLVERGTGANYIMGTMEDITSEKELEKQLIEAENIRENEMRALFQVIQLDPKVLSDFVADSEYEFERINVVLRSKKQLQKEVLVGLYQSIHAVKSNALILNLEGFSERLHKLEATVRMLQEKEEELIPFDELLELVLELNEAMNEIDQLKNTVSKIENFKNLSGGSKNQDRYVLVETLTRVCERTREAVKKKVRLVIEEIDEAVLDYGPRRVIKEVLTQLVRNAVYHGIESPEDREPLGKEPEGEIRLSMKYVGNQIVIKLADNGGGIDFGRVRQSAESQNLLFDPAKANDKSFLMKTIFAPGFSTLGEADYHAGRGIGLSLVKDRIKDLHGNIAVSTSQGKGTTFTISIPMELPTVDKVS